MILTLNLWPGVCRAALHRPPLSSGQSIPVFLKRLGAFAPIHYFFLPSFAGAASPAPANNQETPAPPPTDAEPGEDGLLDGFVAAQFQVRAGGDAVLSEAPLDRDARARALFSRINQGSSAGSVLSPVL